MSDSFEFTLHSPMTEEDWNKLSDVEHEKTKSVTFQTPQGRQVKYIKCEVLDKIRAEIKEEEKVEHIPEDVNMWHYIRALDRTLSIIDKYMAEGSEE